MYTISSKMKEYYLEGEERIYYRKNKFLKRPSIVFVHGLSGSSSGWIPYEKIFENKFNVLSLDLRGHGKSFRPKKFNEYTIDKFSNDIYRIIKKEKINKFILVGHSLGSLVVLDFVKNHQNLLKAFVLVSADAAPGKRRLTRIILPFLYLSKIFYILPQIKKSGRHIDYKNYIGTGDWNVKRTIVDLINIGIKSDLYSLHNAYKFDIEEFLPKIKIPTLIIHGDKDTVFPIRAGINIHEKIKNSKMVVFDGLDHIIVINGVDRLSNEIDKFVSSLK